MSTCLSLSLSLSHTHTHTHPSVYSKHVCFCTVALVAWTRWTMRVYACSGHWKVWCVLMVKHDEERRLRSAEFNRKRSFERYRSFQVQCRSTSPLSSPWRTQGFLLFRSSGKLLWRMRRWQRTRLAKICPTSWLFSGLLHHAWFKFTKIQFDHFGWGLHWPEGARGP